jgi:glyoxylase I family protein
MKGNNKKIGGGGFHHIAMQVKDFDITYKFYVETLGFKEKISWGGDGSRAVMLDTGDGNYIEIFEGRKKPADKDGMIMHLALRTDNCDAAIERVRVAGMEITDEPKDIEVPSTPPIKIRIAFCKGPDGEIIEFFQNELT